MDKITFESVMEELKNCLVDALLMDIDVVVDVADRVP
jgi:hypothetical protein